MSEEKSVLEHLMQNSTALGRIEARLDSVEIGRAHV
jgi:hypothetical protein